MSSKSTKKLLGAALFAAAHDGGVEQVRRAVAEAQRVQLRDALIRACEAVDGKAVDALIAAGAEVTCGPSDARAPLSAVFEQKAYLGKEAARILTRLLDLGAPIDAEPCGSRTALALAVHGNHLGLAQLLVDRGSDVHQRDKRGQSLLHIAMRGRGEEPVVAFLVSHGLDVRALDAEQDSLLHAAVSTAEGRAMCDRVRLLVGAGVDVNARNASGQTPLHVAAAQRVRWPLDAEHDAAMLLLDLGADVNARSDDGVAPLHDAVESDGDPSAFVKALLERGADVNARTNLGNTPLLCLVRGTEHSPTRDRLLRSLVKEHGADVNALNMMASRRLAAPSSMAPCRSGRR